MKIRKGDKVQVMSGKQKDRGIIGEVVKVFRDKNKVLIKGINIVTKHIKKSGKNPGQILKVEKPIDASNVMLICPFTSKLTRIGFVLIKEKDKLKKFRYSKKALKEQKGIAKDFIIK